MQRLEHLPTLKFSIDKERAFRYTSLCQRETRGGIAQLGERLHGMQEVRGSIPLVSTISDVRGCERNLASFLFAFGKIKTASLLKAIRIHINGASGGIRTLDPRLRRPLLYPTELQVQWSG